MRIRSVFRQAALCCRDNWGVLLLLSLATALCNVTIDELLLSPTLWRIIASLAIGLVGIFLECAAMLVCLRPAQDENRWVQALKTTGVYLLTTLKIGLILNLATKGLILVVALCSAAPVAVAAALGVLALLAGFLLHAKLYLALPLAVDQPRREAPVSRAMELAEKRLIKLSVIILPYLLTNALFSAVCRLKPVQLPAVTASFTIVALLLLPFGISALAKAYQQAVQTEEEAAGSGELDQK